MITKGNMTILTVITLRGFPFIMFQNKVVFYFSRIAAKP